MTVEAPAAQVFVSSDELATLMQTDKVVPIDIRDAEEYAAGHIPGAVNIADVFYYLATTDQTGVTEFEQHFCELFSKAGLTGAELAVCYEDGLSLKAPRGYWMLEYLGYPRIAVLQNGYKGWVAGGHPVSTSAPLDAAPSGFPLAPRREMMCTKEQMLASLSSPDIIRLDVRDREEWESESSSPYGVDFAPRKGRIPGATWIDWNLFLTLGESTAGTFNVAMDKGELKELKQIEEQLSSRGITREREVILYCFKGARTSTTYLALKQLGYRNVRNYLGSWNEWSRDPAMPVE